MWLGPRGAVQLQIAPPFHLAWPAGTRVLLQAVAGFILHQPPLAVLLQQCVIMALVSNNRDYCACRLLDNPLAAQRLALLSRCLDAIPLFTVQLTSAATLRNQGKKRCLSPTAAAACGMPS